MNDVDTILKELWGLQTAKVHSRHHHHEKDFWGQSYDIHVLWGFAYYVK